MQYKQAMFLRKDKFLCIDCLTDEQRSVNDMSLDFFPMLLYIWLALLSVSFMQ